MGIRGSEEGRLGSCSPRPLSADPVAQTFLRALMGLLHLEQPLLTSELLLPSPDTCPARAHGAWLKASSAHCLQQTSSTATASLTLESQRLLPLTLGLPVATSRPCATRHVFMTRKDQ